MGTSSIINIATKCVFLDVLSSYDWKTHIEHHTYWFLNLIPTICNIFWTEKELLAYKMKGKDGILADEDSDGKQHSIFLKKILNMDACKREKRPIRQLEVIWFSSFCCFHSWTLAQSTCFYPLMWQFKFF